MLVKMLKNSKVVFYIMRKNGYEALRSVLNKKYLISHVVIGKNRLLVNDYNQEIKKLCKLNNIKYYYKGSEPKVHKSYYIFAISWRWMISHPNKNLRIFHDSILPKYRGFTPLVNMLINGEKKIGYSAIFGSKEYDKGDIIETKQSNISYPIKIYDAINKNNLNLKILVKNILYKIFNSEKIKSKPQSQKRASYSVWRNEDDYFIDWKKSAVEIKRFIDATGYPYLGAKTRYGKNLEIFIYDVEVYKDINCENRDVGKVIFIDKKFPVVICAKGLIKITHAKYNFKKKMKNFLPLKSMRIKFC